jgi:hypothetical protein
MKTDKPTPDINAAHNKPSDPVMLERTPECQHEGCTGHPVAVYHRLDGRYVNALEWVMGRRYAGVRLYSGMCWAHQKWDVFKGTKTGMYASGKLPLHSKIVR